ncbi:MAG: 2,3-epoxybenzoyl-CoA dihydrolase [Ruegeria sp.]|uniref:2,3-epoxybenzoyl-CoA dihydrolase n=1 Tax=Ruegeria sp. TaxID=1879320 RepID=UPI00349E79C7
MPQRIDFQTDPSKYRHWRVEYDGEIANLFMDVEEKGGLFPGYELKLNSYDLGVDIELADVVQRMRFEHPEVKVVVVQSAKDRVFCAGANIRMLGGASHAHKVNFCKFTNETRNTYEAAEADSGQKYIAAIKGSCAGGGYELALACNHIILTNDSTSSVALPEVPLLAVLPGTGGLTRVTDKRKVRRDLADVFCSVEEGVRGQRAVDWKLVDEIAPNSKFDEVVQERARAFADTSAKPSKLQGIELTPLTRSFGEDGSVIYSTVEVGIDRDGGRATVTIKGPDEDAPADTETLQAQGADSWMLRLARELDDAILHLRLNERETGLIVFHTQGDPGRVLAHEKLLLDNRDHWLANEILHYWKRVLKRIDMTSRSLVALVEHGSCYAGVLAELLWAADRSYMMLEEFEGDNRPLAAITLSEANFGAYPMSNDLSRLATRFWADTGEADKLRDHIGEAIEADEAEELGLITYAFDDIDWEDEVRIFLEERASFSPDAMTGMEANLRFVGPETMETRIFGRLTAWQNWIFQRPNAMGEEGALQRYGSGVRGKYDMERV